MKNYLYILLFLLLLPSLLFAQGDYYRSIDGVKGGKELKTALHNLVKKHKQIPYGTGANSTWNAFYTTDAVTDGDRRRVVDMYSDSVRYFEKKGRSITGMNIEHSVAKSWWGGGENDAYFDLHHLNPADAEANGRKNNYPLGELTSVTWQNGVTFVGKANIAGVSQNAYEPCDEYKGDFARVFMYMFTCYQHLTWKYTWMCYEKSTYPTLKPWAVELLLRWHRQDPVSQKERDRNNAVYEIQGNRNPFIDYPQLAHFVWGDSVGCVFSVPQDVKCEAVAVNNGSVPKLSPNEFALIRDASQLSLGDTIIIVCDGVALTTEQRPNNRGAAAVSVLDGKLHSPSPNVQKIVLKRGASKGTVAFDVCGGYLYAASSSGNFLRTQSSVDGNASWLLKVDKNGAADISANGSSTRKLLRYNATAKIFACYANGQKTVMIFAKSPATAK